MRKLCVRSLHLLTVSRQIFYLSVFQLFLPFSPAALCCTVPHRPLLSSVTLCLFPGFKHNHFLEPEPATQFPGFKCQLPHCFELSSLPPSLRSHLLTFMLSLLPVFTFSQSVSESVSKSVSFYLPPSLSLPHSHIAHAPMGKLLSLSMNSVVLLLPLDPKGNIMNNEQKQWKWGVVGGGGERKSSRVRESE